MLAKMLKRRSGWLSKRRGKHHAIGARGERQAQVWLRKNGYRILERNALTPAGEADILCVAPDKKTIVIVEVKSRIASAGPSAEDAVGITKQAKLRAVMSYLVRANGWTERPLRIDVIAIEFPERDARKGNIRHYPAAVVGG